MFRIGTGWAAVCEEGKIAAVSAVPSLFIQHGAGAWGWRGVAQ